MFLLLFLGWEPLLKDKIPNKIKEALSVAHCGIVGKYLGFKSELVGLNLALVE